MADLSPAEWTAIWLSLQIATAATIASLPFGIFIAYALARWRFPGKTLLNGAVHLPLVLPPVVTGFLLLILLGRKGVFGTFLADIGIVLSFRWTGAAVACAVMGFPLMVRAMRLSFEAIDRRLEQAAGTLAPIAHGRFFLSACRSRHRALLPAPFFPSPRRSASSVRRSPLFRIFRARPRPSHRPSIPTRKFPAATQAPCV